MNKPNPIEVLNENISYLVDIMKLEIDEIGQKHDFTPDQISEMEKDFIARLAFAAIKYGDKKEEEEDCENCPAKDRCSFKEPEKKEPEKKTFPDDVWKALRFIKNNCDHECKDCPFGSGSGLICDLNNLPSYWEV